MAQYETDFFDVLIFNLSALTNFIYVLGLFFYVLIFNFNK